MTTATATGGTLGWTLKRTLVRLRWPGLVGLALLAVAALVQAFVIPPMKSRVDVLRAEARQISARGGKAGSAEPPSTSAQLANFYGFFPPLKTLPAVLGDLQVSAQHNGLGLDKGEYRLQRDAQFPLMRYQITLPVTGNYAQIRGFISEVLQRIPASALEDLVMKRESVAAQQLEGRVRFVVFVNNR